MSCGYTLIESGGVRSQNAGHSLFKTLLVFSEYSIFLFIFSVYLKSFFYLITMLHIISVTTALAYWIFGYAFAFGENPNVILGTRFWASERLGAKDLYPGVENFTNSNNVYKLNNQDPYIHFFYQFMLAFLVTNIAASSFAERCRVPVYVLFSILISGSL